MSGKKGFIIDFNTVVKDIDGKNMKLPGGNSDATLRDVATNALLNGDDVRAIDGNEKYKRGKLAEKVNNKNVNGGIELGIEDLNLLKELIGKTQPPQVVKQSWDILDPIMKKSEG